MRRCAQREFADDQAVARDVLGERAVALRINDVRACSQHGYGGTRRFQTAAEEDFSRRSRRV